MWSRRAELFRKTCVLIADDRRRAGRDCVYHLSLVEMMDLCARDLLKSLKKINRVLDAHLKG